MRASSQCLLTVLVLALLAGSGAAQIDVDFSATPLSGDLPLTVQFTNLTTGGTLTAMIWGFGDGLFSALPNPTHTYTTPGVYTVSLWVFSATAGSDTETKPGLITVDPVPLAPEFSAQPSSGRLPLTVHFADMTTGTSPTGWSWDFGDGATSSQQNPSHSYQTSGPYTVSLTSSYLGQTATITKPGIVNVFVPELKPDFTVAHVVGSTPYTVSFVDQSQGVIPTKRLWDFGDGFFATQQNPTHQYGLPGDYTVSLKISYFGDSATIVKPDAVTLAPIPLEPDFTLTPSSGVSPVVVTFTNTSIGGPAQWWRWDFGDGSFFSSLETPPPHTYSVPGRYTVTLTMAINQQLVTMVKPEAVIVDRAEILPDFDVLNPVGTNPHTVTLIDTTPGTWPINGSGSSAAGTLSAATPRPPRRSALRAPTTSRSRSSSGPNPRPSPSAA